VHAGNVSTLSGFIGSATGTNVPRFPWLGAVSATSTALFGSIHSTHVSASGTIQRVIPHFNMRNF
jgi:hypothetical protein